MEEMTALEFLKEWQRMCNTYDDGCNWCPMREISRDYGSACSPAGFRKFEKTVSIVKKWSEEHPRKTILQDLLEKYPKTVLTEYGDPDAICPYHLGYEKEPEGDNELCYLESNDGCKRCWNRPLEEVEKNG